MRRVAVIGAGVVGLSTAVNVQVSAPQSSTAFGHTDPAHRRMRTRISVYCITIGISTPGVGHTICAFVLSD